MNGAGRCEPRASRQQGQRHPGSGLPVIFESARIASRLLLEDLKIKAPARPMRASRPRPALAELT